MITTKLFYFFFIKQMFKFFTKKCVNCEKQKIPVLQGSTCSFGFFRCYWCPWRPSNTKQCPVCKDARSVDDNNLCNFCKDFIFTSFFGVSTIVSFIFCYVYYSRNNNKI